MRSGSAKKNEIRPFPYPIKTVFIVLHDIPKKRMISVNNDMILILITLLCVLARF
jgi:hypothetical protein